MDNNEKSNYSIDNVEPQVSAMGIFLYLLAALWGVVIALTVLPLVLPGMAESIISAQPKVYWYLSRGSALVAYGLLWFSMVLGVGVTNKLAAKWPGLGKSNELHQYISILGIAFGLFHGLILLGDAYSNFKLVQILVPFTTSTYRPLAVGLGQIGFYLWAVLLGSFYVRKRIGSKAWRFIHYFSYLTFISVLLHALLAGSDAGLQATQIYYWVTGAALLFLTVYRILYEIENAAEKRKRMAAIRN
jgi:predicted ferric reductase